MAETSAPQSILLILMGSIGDVVRGMSMVAPLKSAFPNAALTWLVEPLCAPLVRQHPLIDRVIVFERSKPLRGILRLRNELREKKFDITLDLQRHFKSGFFSWLSGAQRRIGFHRSDAKEGNSLFQTETIPGAGEGIPKIHHYWMFLRLLGVDAPRSPRFGLAEGQPAEATARLIGGIQGSYVALVLGSSWSSKDWPLEGYAQLVRRILESSSHRVVLCGDSSQIDRAKELQAGFDTGGRVLNLVNRTSLVDLTFVLKGAQACVGPDSGPAHISSAVGTPHVTLFGPTSAGRVAPFGSEAFSLQSMVGCSPCYRRKCPGLDRLCMRLLSADAVWQLLELALRQRKELRAEQSGR